ncbi:YihY/virulence factor BrkB family protein [Agromyces protaetiae]|uniref:YihY/virulence factor BrkB family protein n=1 Tax=Agromyces protaetiae TaxID=2509455 RepID=UPI001FB7096A|nr:YihY/virulence factor BrkB family protein [Agromyces protaetiae]
MTKRTLALFPVRVWRRFLAQNGFILSAGMSYQSLFAVFAALYVAFAVAGIWLTGNPDRLNAFVTLVNTYAPGLVSDGGQAGVVSKDDLVAIATRSTSLFGVTGVVAVGGLIWTAIGWVTYTRTAVRSIFGLPKDTRAYVILKARDFLAGFGFGAVLLIAAVLSIIATSLLDWLRDFFGWDFGSGWNSAFIQFGALAVVFVIDTLALAVMFRFLSGANMAWRRMWVGSLLGSAGLAVLQFFGGVLLTGASANPLLATFAVFIGLLLWFRFTSIVILVAAAWIAEEASDANDSLLDLSPEEQEAERQRREYAALVTAGEVEVREAREDVSQANWIEGFSARRRLARAEQDLADLVASPPPAVVAARAKKDVGGLP